MVRTFRALYRLFYFLTVTLVLTMLWVIRIPFLRARSRVHWRSTMVRLWARIILRAIGASIHVRGEPPHPPYLMVSNHLGYLDVIVYQSQLPCVFVAKSEVAYWPLLGWLARAIGTVFINRRRKKDVVRVNSEIDKALDRGEGVIIFPEGTSGNGEKVLPFKTAILGAVEETDIQVHYATISYRTPPGESPATEVLCWWGDMTFVDHFFNMLKLPSFEATVVFGEEAVEASNRKEMARLLNEKVSENFVPVA